MKQLFTTLFLLITLCGWASSTTETITVDDRERSFIVYTPTKFESTKQYPVLVLLHPMSMSASKFTEMIDAQSISDNNSALVVFPDALDEQNTELTNVYSIMAQREISIPGMSSKGVWGAGARISMDDVKAMVGSQAASLLPLLMPESTAAGYIEFNKGIDDIKFINAVLDYMTAHYYASKRVYMAGASLGGTMTYKYAYSSENRASKIAVAHGFVGSDVNTDAALNMPVCVFHSKADSIVHYDGGVFCGSIPSLVQKIATNNGLTKQTTEDIPDTADDGFKVTKTTYYGDTLKTVYFYVVDNATHFDILTSEKNDIDYIATLEKFFFYTNPLKVDEVQLDAVTLYPNPTSDYIICNELGNYQLVNEEGQIILAGKNDGTIIDLQSVEKGVYIFLLYKDGETKSARIIKK